MYLPYEKINIKLPNGNMRKAQKRGNKIYYVQHCDGKQYCIVGSIVNDIFVPNKSEHLKIIMESNYIRNRTIPYAEDVHEYRQRCNEYRRKIKQISIEKFGKITKFNDVYRTMSYTNLNGYGYINFKGENKRY